MNSHGGQSETRGLNGRVRHEVTQLARRHAKHPVVVGEYINGERNTEHDKEQISDGQVDYETVGYVVQFLVGHGYVHN